MWALEAQRKPINQSENCQQINNVILVTQYPASQFTERQLMSDFLACTFGHILHWVQQTFHVQFPVLVNHSKWNTFVTAAESQ